MGKKGWVKDICKSEKPDILGLQETKCEEIDEEWLEDVWGSRSFGFAQKGADVASGGIIIVWDINIFSAIQSTCVDGFVVVSGNRKGIDKEVTFYNVYAPQAEDKKQELWNMPVMVMDNTI